VELDCGESYLTACEGALGDNSAAETPTLLTAWTSYARVLLSANEFFYVD
jgi:hypothetical protein